MLIDTMCLTPAGLILQKPQIFNSTSIRIKWTVQWNCPYTYSRPPVMYTVFVESSDGPVNEYYNKVCHSILHSPHEYLQTLYTSYIDIKNVSYNVNYNITVIGETEFTVASLSNSKYCYTTCTPALLCVTVYFRYID